MVSQQYELDPVLCLSSLSGGTDHPNAIAASDPISVFYCFRFNWLCVGTERRLYQLM